MLGLAAVVGLLLIVGIGGALLDGDDAPIEPSPSTRACGPGANGGTRRRQSDGDSRSRAYARRLSSGRSRCQGSRSGDDPRARRGRCGRGGNSRPGRGARAAPARWKSSSVKERKGWALGRVMVAEDCAAKAAANADAALVSARDAATALEIAEQAAGHRMCAEDAADAAQQWAEDAELWLAAECINDYLQPRLASAGQLGCGMGTRLRSTRPDHGALRLSEPIKPQPFGAWLCGRRGRVPRQHGHSQQAGGVARVPARRRHPMARRLDRRSHQRARSVPVGCTRTTESLASSVWLSAWLRHQLRRRLPEAADPKLA